MSVELYSKKFNDMLRQCEFNSSRLVRFLFVFSYTVKTREIGSGNENKRTAAKIVMEFLKTQFGDHIISQKSGLSWYWPAHSPLTSILWITASGVSVKTKFIILS